MALVAKVKVKFTTLLERTHFCSAILFVDYLVSHIHVKKSWDSMEVQVRIEVISIPSFLFAVLSSGLYIDQIKRLHKLLYTRNNIPGIVSHSDSIYWKHLSCAIQNCTKKSCHSVNENNWSQITLDFNVLNKIFLVFLCPHPLKLWTLEIIYHIFEHLERLITQYMTYMHSLNVSLISNEKLSIILIFNLFSIRILTFCNTEKGYRLHTKKDSHNLLCNFSKCYYCQFHMKVCRIRLLSHPSIPPPFPH